MAQVSNGRTKQTELCARRVAPDDDFCLAHRQSSSSAEKSEARYIFESSSDCLCQFIRIPDNQDTAGWFPASRIEIEARRLLECGWVRSGREMRDFYGELALIEFIRLSDYNPANSQTVQKEEPVDYDPEAAYSKFVVTKISWYAENKTALPFPSVMKLVKAEWDDLSEVLRYGYMPSLSVKKENDSDDDSTDYFG